MEEISHKEKLRLAGVKRHGSENAWREFQKNSGAKADRSTPRGFAVLKNTNPELQKEISRKAAEMRWHSNKTNPSLPKQG